MHDAMHYAMHHVMHHALQCTMWYIFLFHFTMQRMVQAPKEPVIQTWLSPLPGGF